MPSRREEETGGKGADGKETSAPRSDRSELEKFHALARRLYGVPRSEVEQKRGKKKKRGKRK